MFSIKLGYSKKLLPQPEWNNSMITKSLKRPCSMRCHNLDIYQRLVEMFPIPFPWYKTLERRQDVSPKCRLLSQQIELGPFSEGSNIHCTAVGVSNVSTSSIYCLYMPENNMYFRASISGVRNVPERYSADLTAVAEHVGMSMNIDGVSHCTPGY